MPRNDPVLAGSVCLALVCEGEVHGWAVASALAPGTELGRIWSLSRPLTYRALDGLVEDGLAERRGTEPGRGRARKVLAATRRGRAANDRWLATPVSHPRDVRTELLLKLELLDRRGRSPVDLLLAQRAAFASVFDSLRSVPADTIDGIWRHEHITAIRRFLDRSIDLAETGGASR